MMFLVDSLSFTVLSPHFNQHRGIDNIMECDDGGEIPGRDYNLAKRTLCKLETKYNFSSGLKGINEIDQTKGSLIRAFMFLSGSIWGSTYLVFCAKIRKKSMRRVAVFYIFSQSTLLCGLIEDN